MRNLKLLSILFLGMILLFAACKKEEIKVDPTPPIVYGDSLLKTYTFDGIKYDFKYNEYRQVSEFEVGDAGSTEKTLVKFEYSGNKLLRWVAYDNGNVVAKVNFLNHNAYDFPTKGELYIADDGPLELMESYQYIYTGNKMTELIASEVDAGQATVVYKNEYIYSDGNVVTQKMYESYYGTLVPILVANFTLDDKHNPGFKFGFINFAEDEIFQGMSVMDRNNYTIMEVKDADGNLKESDSYNRTFEYNADNYPTKCTMTSFDGNETIDIKYEY